MYSALGFEQTFYYSALILAVPLLFQIFFIPNRLNHVSNDQIEIAASLISHNQIYEETQYNQKEITFKMLITNWRVMLASISSIVALICMQFYMPILTVHLLEIGISESYLGFVLALGTFTYAVNCPIVGIISHKIRKLYLTQLAFVLAFISLMLLGPSEVLGFKESYGIVISGVALLGYAMSFIFVPLLSEIIDAVKEKEKVPDSAILNDTASGMFNISYSTGCLLAPILGGFFND